MNLLLSPTSSRWTSALMLPAALVALAPTLGAQSEEDDTYMGEDPDNYSSVRVLEGSATIRKGDVEEALSRGVPVAEGDVVESRGRGILQLGDGTRVAFGPGTRFQVAALFRDQDRSRQVLLRLDRGRLRVAGGRESDARIRIDTPSGSAILQDRATADLEVQQDGTSRVKVLSGRTTFFNERDKVALSAGERLTVAGDQDRLDNIRSFNTYGGDAFDAWCERSMQAQRGPSWDKVPQELRYYSDDLDANGEWVYVDDYRSWCWRPVRVAPEWRPYWQGRWGAYPGGMTWISSEPWGYVTYHHGRWGWSAAVGWFWIPGVYYAPAWVAWQSDTSYFGWAPMGYYNTPVAWNYGAWGGGVCWNVIDIHFVYSHHVHDHIYRDHGPIHHFDPGPGRPGGYGPGTPPRWHRGPLPVRPAEFRNPALFQKAVQDPRALNDRLRAYEQQTGRVVYRQPPLPRKPAPSTQPPSTPRGFEDPSHLPHRVVFPAGRQEGTPGGSVPPVQPGRKPVPSLPPAGPNPAPGPRATAPGSQPGQPVRKPVPSLPPTNPNPTPGPGATAPGPQPGQPGRKPMPSLPPTDPTPGPGATAPGPRPGQPVPKPMPSPNPPAPRTQGSQSSRNPAPGPFPRVPSQGPEAGRNPQQTRPAGPSGGGGNPKPGGTPPPLVWPKPQKPAQPNP